LTVSRDGVAEGYLNASNGRTQDGTAGARALAPANDVIVLYAGSAHLDSTGSGYRLVGDYWAYLPLMVNK
jgi:hypothetical protein